MRFKIHQKVIARVLVAMLLIGMMPITALADTEGTTTETIAESEVSGQTGSQTTGQTDGTADNPVDNTSLNTDVGTAVSASSGQSQTAVSGTGSSDADTQSTTNTTGTSETTGSGTESASDENSATVDAAAAESETGTDDEEASEEPMLLAAGAPRNVTATLSNIVFQSSSGLTTLTSGRMNYNSRYRFAFDWSIAETASSPTLKAGDYFTVQLPDIFTVPSDFQTFDMMDSTGTVIAVGNISNGVLTATFTENVEGKTNVNGTAYVVFTFDQTKITVGQSYTFKIGDEEFTYTISGNGAPSASELIAKWGWDASGTSLQAGWTVRINFAGQDLRNVVITDSLEGTGETYVSIWLNEVTYSATGSQSSTGQSYTFDELLSSGMLTLNDTKTSFTLNLGDIGTKQYAMGYYTTYTPGTTLTNGITLTADDNTEQSRTAKYMRSFAGGTASGENVGKITINKVDATDGTPLAGAVFRITRPNGLTFELTTDEEGTAESNYLIFGEYTVEEITAPDGYVLDDTQYTVTLNSSSAALTVKNSKPASVTIPVTKIITGAETTEDKEFSFAIAAGEDNADAPMPADNTVAVTGAGTTSFGPMEYTAEGTYTYTVQEVQGTEEGYTYDTTVHTVIVTVTKVDDVLQASWTVDGEAAESVSFTNVYQPEEEEPVVTEKTTNKKSSGTKKSTKTTTSKSSSQKSTSAPKTGDASRTGMWLLVLAAAAGSIAMIGKKKRSRKVN